MSQGIDPAGLQFKFFRNYADSLSREMNVDGSTPVHFDVRVDGTLSFIHRVNISIVDGGILPITFWGISALSTGLKIRVVTFADDVTVRDFLDGETIKTNTDWVYLSGVDSTVVPVAQPNDDHIPIRWTLSKATGGKPLKLVTGQALRITVQDNISALTSFRVMAQGTT